MPSRSCGARRLGLQYALEQAALRVGWFCYFSVGKDVGLVCDDSVAAEASDAAYSAGGRRQRHKKQRVESHQTVAGARASVGATSILRCGPGGRAARLLAKPVMRVGRQRHRLHRGSLAR